MTDQLSFLDAAAPAGRPGEYPLPIGGQVEACRSCGAQIVSAGGWESFENRTKLAATTVGVDSSLPRASSTSLLPGSAVAHGRALATRLTPSAIPRSSM